MSAIDHDAIGATCAHEKMAEGREDSRIRNNDWQTDADLKEDLERYVRKNMKRSEVLDFISTDYPMYAWSLRSLARRLQYFDIKYTDYEVGVEEIRQAVQEELQGPGKLLGYRGMQQKIREIHELNVPRDVVYGMMVEEDPEGLEMRGGVGVSKRPKRKNAFISGGSDYTMSCDGHDKLCGYQKSMFPLCVYGGLDTYSRRVNFLRVWNTNNNPKVIGRFYFEYLCESKVLPNILRVDRGTETDDLAAIHCYLRAKQGDLEKATDAILYGPSTQNKIERWWRELLDRLEYYFKDQLKSLLESGDYDATDPLDRDMLAYVYIPVIQKELDIFRECVWNSHRCRKQKAKELPAGIPEHIYHFPEKYGAKKCGFNVTAEELEEIAELSDILGDHDDFLTVAVRQECQQHLPDPRDIAPKDAKESYIYLKSCVNKSAF